MRKIDVLIFQGDPIEAYEILTGFYTKPDDEELNNMLNEEDW